MEKKNYIRLLDKLYQGKTSDEENSILKDGLEKPEFKEDFDKYFQHCWYLATNEPDLNVQADMFAELSEKIEHPDKINIKVAPKPVPFLSRSLIRYAAAALLLIAVGAGAFLVGLNRSGEGSGVVSFAAGKGQKANMILADGTHVYINSSSKITYDNSYNRKSRIISLEGEAYFEVAKDKTRPFIVKTNGIQVQALGTHFNVKSYSTDNSISVILLEGSVRVDSKQQSQMLKPNEQLEYNIASKSFKKSEIIPNKDGMLWRSNELVFYGESLENICNNLERIYECKFVFMVPEHKNLTYNGTIKNKSLKNVLEFLSQSASFKYKETAGDSIIIY
jgi:ferric-dicitrate binding protein FerR (iron transport regulator)